MSSDVGVGFLATVFHRYVDDRRDRQPDKEMMKPVLGAASLEN
jgi:hypothetical protein